MNRILSFFLILTLLGGAAFAQRQSRPVPAPKHDISQMVSNLTTKQKKQLEAVSDQSSARVDQYRKRLDKVRDSIHYYMAKEGDYTSRLFPLFEKEAALELQINKELYATRVKLDKILTKKQRAELTKKIEQKRAHHQDRPAPRPVKAALPKPDASKKAVK